MSVKERILALEEQVADLKRQNELLLSREKLIQNDLHDILNHMGDPVFVKNDESKLIVANDAFCKIFALPRKEILGRTLAENVPPDERDEFLRVDNQVLTDGVENINEETLTAGNAEPLVVSTRKTRFIDEQGNKFLIGVIRDITHSRKLEHTLRLSENKLRELHRTKDKFYSIIAHDMRSPLTGVLGLSQLISDETKEEQTKKFVNLINRSVANSLDLLDNLLQWAHIQTDNIVPRLERIQIQSTVEDVINNLESASSVKNIFVTQAVSPRIIVYTDKNMLNTLLRNLISNAIKFTNAKGEINISARELDGEVIISVSDNGVGMSKHTQEHLFEKTINVSSNGTFNEKGSGLGLVLCKEFVEQLGGKIWVKSNPGSGSKFEFSLPSVT